MVQIHGTQVLLECQDEKLTKSQSWAIESLGSKDPVAIRRAEGAQRKRCQVGNWRIKNNFFWLELQYFSMEVALALGQWHFIIMGTSHLLKRFDIPGLTH